MIFNIIGYIIAGGIIGGLARLAIPGKQDMPIWATVALGAIGMFLGGIVGNVLPFDNQGVPWIMGVVMAVVTLFGAIKSGVLDQLN